MGNGDADEVLGERFSQAKHNTILRLASSCSFGVGLDERLLLDTSSSNCGVGGGKVVGQQNFQRDNDQIFSSFAFAPFLFGDIDTWKCKINSDAAAQLPTRTN